MSPPNNPFDDARHAARHAVVSSLQILTLTAELLALELRDGNTAHEQVQARGRALADALAQVTQAAHSIPARYIEAGTDNGGSFADSVSLRDIQAFVGLIAHHVPQPDVERDVLAEYVDKLHEQAAALIQSIDDSMTG